MAATLRAESRTKELETRNQISISEVSLTLLVTVLHICHGQGLGDEASNVLPTILVGDRDQLPNEHRRFMKVIKQMSCRQQGQNG